MAKTSSRSAVCAEDYYSRYYLFIAMVKKRFVAASQVQVEAFPVPPALEEPCEKCGGAYDELMHDTEYGHWSTRCKNHSRHLKY